jgi:hypothetical protein
MPVVGGGPVQNFGPIRGGVSPSETHPWGEGPDAGPLSWWMSSEGGKDGRLRGGFRGDGREKRSEKIFFFSFVNVKCSHVRESYDVILTPTSANPYT